MYWQKLDLNQPVLSLRIQASKFEFDRNKLQTLQFGLHVASVEIRPAETQLSGRRGCVGTSRLRHSFNVNWKLFQRRSICSSAAKYLTLFDLLLLTFLCVCVCVLTRTLIRKLGAHLWSAWEQILCGCTRFKGPISGSYLYFWFLYTF